MANNRLLSKNNTNIIIPSMKDLGISGITDIKNTTMPSVPVPDDIVQSYLAKINREKLMTGLADFVGNVGGTAISGGLNSNAGNAITGVGTALGTGLSFVNPLIGGAVKGASGLLGGITNALWGSKLNQGNITSIENGIDALNNIKINDSSTDSILSQFSNTQFGKDFNQSDIGSDGLFSNKAENKYKSLKNKQEEAIQRALSAFSNAQNNLTSNQVSNALANYSSYGGPIMIRSTGVMSPFGNTFAEGGGIHIKKSRKGTFTAAAKKHGKSVQAFASQVLANKDNYSPAMVKKANFARNFGGRKKAYADGGELFTHGGIFSNGVTEINSGGTHEENPYEGVQMGVDNQGIPNLVEQGEVVYNDYVFSNRIKVPKSVKSKYKLSRETFADVAKYAQKESKERPNDPISLNGLNDIMTKLAGEQENIRMRKGGNKYAKGGNLSYLRYTPILGSTIGALQGLLDKPNYSSADAILEASRDAGRYMPIKAKTIGNYLTYTPFDRNYYTNKIAAQANASRRAITNQGAGNRATRMAGILASDYNTQTQLGDLFRKAEEYNLTNRQAVEAFNRDTDKTNADLLLKTDMANQDAYSKLSNTKLNGVLQAMNMREAIDNARSQAISANLSNLFESLGDVGREEVEASWIRSNPALYYYFGRDGSGMNYKNKSSKGGYLTIKNKRRRK